MVIVDESVLTDPRRLDAVERVRRALAAAPMPVDDLARLAARLLGAPMAQVTLVGGGDEQVAGGHALPGRLNARGALPLDYSVGRYVVSAGAAVRCACLPAGNLLTTRYGIRAFVGVPLHDRDGRAVGALAVLDTDIRNWADDQVRTLREIAEVLQVRAADPAAPPPESLLDAAGGDARFLTALLESLAVGVLACDANGEVVLLNRPVREYMGLPADGAEHDYPAAVRGALFDADGRPLDWAEAPLQRAWRGERVTGADIVIRKPGRRVRMFSTTSRPIVGRDGRRLGAVAVAHDVTPLRRAERFRACHQAVEQSLRSAATAAEAAPEVLAAVGSTLGWAAAELLLIDEVTGELETTGRWTAPGTDLGGVLGMVRVTKGDGIAGRVWATGRPMWVRDIAESLTLRGPELRHVGEACLRHGIRTVLAVPVRDGGTVLGVLSCYAGAPEQHEDLLTVLLDGVAAQIGAYVARRRAEELARQLTRAKDDFIALVSHEMRTPLTSIVASATMLAEEAMDDDSRQLLDAVLRNTTTLRDVVDTLLDLAGLDSGYLGLTIRRVDLAAIVAEAVDAARGRAGGIRIALERTGAIRLDGDPHRLRQVVDDLLANAVKYSLPGGEVRAGLRCAGGVVELTVTDDGIGTPADERDRVFERFYRASNVRHQGIPGRGLGLSLARAVVHLHGGSIMLTGNRPSGTRVTVRLPALQ